MKDARRAYEEELDAMLEDWSAKMALLKARADQADTDARVVHYRTIEALLAQRDEAEARLQELKNAGDEGWDELKAGAEGAWAEVTTALQNAIATS